MSRTEPKIIEQIRSRIVGQVPVNRLDPLVHVDYKVEDIHVPYNVMVAFSVSLQSQCTCPVDMIEETKKVFIEQVRHYIYAEFIEGLLHLREIACEEGSRTMMNKTAEILAYVKGI